MKKRILAFVDLENGRDANILIPVAFFAGKYLNCEVVFRNKYDAHAVYRYKPDLILLPNSVGSPFYFKISKYAFECNIECFALVSEGNYWTNGSYDIYGCNTDRKFYHDFGCYWNKRTLSYNITNYPELNDFYVLTGGIQFDRYRNYRFPKKEDFLKKYNLSQYKKVVGYAAWGFGKLFNKRTIRDNRFVRPNDPNRIEWMKQFMYRVEHTLDQLIKNNSDTLFILKKHPNESMPSDTSRTINEIEKLKSQENVLYLVDENVDTLLSVCDIWMGFDTTTVLEAWLMKNSPTFLLHTEKDFFRDEMHNGSIIIESYDQIQHYLDEFYTTHSIKDFDSISKKRVEIIDSVIGFSDGLNHVRAGIFLKKTLEKQSKSKRVKFKLLFFLRYLMITVLLPLYNRQLFLKIPKLKKAVWIFDNWKMNRLNAYKEKCYDQLEKVHQKFSVREVLDSETKTRQLLQSTLIHKEDGTEFSEK